METALSFRNRDEWRYWLMQNHDKERGLWLRIRKKHARGEGITYGEAVEEALCFGWIDSTVRKGDDEAFVQWFAPRSKGSIWSAANKMRAERLIAEGKMTGAGLAKIEEAKRNGNWEKALGTPRPEAMPDDFQKALQSNRAAKEFFERLSATDQYYFVYWVLSSRRDETRRKRIRDSVEKLSLKKRLTDQ